MQNGQVHVLWTEVILGSVGGEDITCGMQDN
jgi:hypothetical protein